MNDSPCFGLNVNSVHQEQGGNSMNEQKLKEFLYELHETENGGVKIYEAALECVQNDDLKEEWERYLEETQTHVERTREILESFQLDPEKDTPGRKVLRHLADSLVQAIQMAKKAGDPDQAEVVAAECVEIAESKDHHNWEMVGMVLKEMKGDDKKLLKEAHDEIENQEDEHYYHTRGWARELHAQGLEIKAVLPPPEEKKDVKTAMAAAKAIDSRKKSTSKRKAG
jgi:ferritin-like metal-binding protein YciE